MELSERRACSTLVQPRMTQRYKPRQPNKDKTLVAAMKRLSRRYPRYGYRFITAKLHQEGWCVNHKRVHPCLRYLGLHGCRQRLWRNEGLQVPYRHKTKKPPGSPENSCSVKKAEYINHVWTYDFIDDTTEDGRKLKFLTVLDEYTRESPAIDVGRSIRAGDVIGVLEYLFMVRGLPRYIRSDNGSEFIAGAIRKWLADKQVETLYIAPGSPWENGYIESFHARLRDDFLDREIFHTVKEAKVLVESWRLEYNNHRPHSGLGYMTPAAFAASCIPSASPTAQPQEYKI